jgi:L-fuconolactonase
MEATMSDAQPRLGNSLAPPNPAWLAKVSEPALEPELPIVDPHHHLWERGDMIYMYRDLLEDLQAGHNVVSTVFIDCRSMYRKEGPTEMRPVGETEFVNGVAAMFASGSYGASRACAGIVS